MSIVLVDLDSTIADTRPRRELCPTVDASKTWTDYAMGCSADEPMPGTVALLNLLWQSEASIHIVTGRTVAAYDLTREWLRRHRVPFTVLRMHGSEDNPDLTQYKVEYVWQLRRRGVDPVLFIEDWPATALALRAEGVPVMCVNPLYAEMDAYAR